MDQKIVLGATAVIVALISYIPYIRDIFRNKTKPHAFSWLVWGTLTAVGFFGQLSDGGGAGTWVMAFTGMFVLIIFILSLFKGEKNITRTDWLSLIGAVIAIFLWLFTKQPILSVILITLIDALGYIPTFRKSYTKPNEETLFSYLVGIAKWTFGILALENYSFITTLYPASLCLSNTLFVALVVIRRRQIKNQMIKEGEIA